MKEKYISAITTLGEILIDKSNEAAWKDTQIEMRDKEIEQLKIKLQYLENFIEDASNRKENDWICILSW